MRRGTWASQRLGTRPFENARCLYLAHHGHLVSVPPTYHFVGKLPTFFQATGEGGTYLNGIGWVAEMWSGTDFRGLPKAKFANTGAMRLSSQIPYGWASAIQPPNPLLRFRTHQFHPAETLLYHIGADLLRCQDVFLASVSITGERDKVSFAWSSMGLGRNLRTRLSSLHVDRWEGGGSRLPES